MNPDMVTEAPKPPPPQLMSQTPNNNGGGGVSGPMGGGMGAGMSGPASGGMGGAGAGMGAGMNAGMGGGPGGPGGPSPAGNAGMRPGGHNPEKQNLIMSLEQEKQALHPESTAYKLMAREIERVKTGRPEDQRWLEIHSGKHTKISFKVPLPVQDHPQYNFVGKILGPKGNTLKQLQEETRTRMAILGRGSMRDKAKEEELRQEGGKYEHLNDPLHVWIEAFAPPPEAFARLAHSVAELKKFLIPDYHDNIRQQQMGELAAMGDMETPMTRGRGRGGPPMRGGRGMPRGGAGMGARGGMTPRGAPRGAPRGGMARGMRGGRGAPASRGGTPAPRMAPAAERRPYEDPYEDPYSGATESYASEFEQGRFASETEETHGAGGYGGYEASTPSYGKAPSARGRGGYRAAPY